jgi:antitoxin (DNA-binding transcriptional repressor) of toxin-antitoxin stability system
MHKAKTSLSSLVTAIEDGRESEIVIARNGRLLLAAFAPKKTHRRRRREIHGSRRHQFTERGNRTLFLRRGLTAMRFLLNIQVAFRAGDDFLQT